MRALAATVLLLAAGCASTPPEEDPVQIKLNELDTRLGRVERVVNNQSLVSLGQRLDQLEADVRALRGAVEELQNTNDGVRKQQRDLYADLDKRLAALEASARGGGAAPAPAPASSPTPAAASAASAAPSGVAGAAAAPASQPIPAESTGGGPVSASPAEQTAYAQAFDLLKNSNYPAAANAFKGFLTTYPLSDLASNAQYWLGETYYVTGDYPSALDAFQKVVRDWPASRKAPDALVKLGFTQVAMKRVPAARSTLNLVLSQYPGSDAAKLAQEQLSKLPATP